MIHLVYSLNSESYDGILTSLLSIFRRSVVDCYKVYVLMVDDKCHQSLRPEQLFYLEKMIKEYNPNNEFVPLDITALYRDCFKMDDSYLNRLYLFADAVEELPDKVLYLDSDCIFNKDVHLLYNQDICDVEYAAARQHKIFHHHLDTSVLLLNLKMCRKTKLLAKTRNSLAFPFITPEVILSLKGHKKKILPRKFNDQKRIHKDTVVRHFTKKFTLFPFPHKEDIKPYHVELVHDKYKYHQFDDIYVAYSLVKLQIDSCL